MVWKDVGVAGSSTMRLVSVWKRGLLASWLVWLVWVWRIGLLSVMFLVEKVGSSVEKGDFDVGIPIFCQNGCEVGVGSVGERGGRRLDWECWEHVKWCGVLMCAEPFG